jgi:hypothetical protein
LLGVDRALGAHGLGQGKLLGGLLLGALVGERVGGGGLELPGGLGRILALQGGLPLLEGGTGGLALVGGGLGALDRRVVGLLVFRGKLVGLDLLEGRQRLFVLTPAVLLDALLEKVGVAGLGLLGEEVGDNPDEGARGGGGTVCVVTGLGGAGRGQRPEVGRGAAGDRQRDHACAASAADIRCGLVVGGPDATSLGTVVVKHSVPPGGRTSQSRGVPSGRTPLRPMCASRSTAAEAHAKPEARAGRRAGGAVAPIRGSTGQACGGRVEGREDMRGKTYVEEGSWCRTRGCQTRGVWRTCDLDRAVRATRRRSL